ncbi:MAG: peptide MFS transporter [Phycisphaerales bacterium]
MARQHDPDSIPVPPEAAAATDRPPLIPLEPTGRQFLGHPPGLFLLFLVEMWERFSYYGMRALLVLYLAAVLAVHELAPGHYTNRISFTEIRQVDDKDAPAQVVDGKEVRDSQSRLIGIRAGSGAAAASPAEPSVVGSPALIIRQLKAVPDPADAEGKKTTWVVDETAATDPAVLTAQPGERAELTEVRYRISNPSNEKLKLVVEVNRDQEDRSFFTVNDNTDAISVIVEPDTKRAADQKEPVDIILATNTYQSGRNWTEAKANTLFGWYTGLAYLFPILGGLIADKLIGTHRSMLIGGVLISIGHVILAVSGLGGLAHSPAGMSLFITGLAVIVVGTGHFKPTVSVMVGQLYRAGDPRRDGAYTIFYMGINLGAFLCAFVCGTLGETVNWHLGFGSAAVGMLLGLGLYLWGRPRFLTGIGDAPKANASQTATGIMVLALALAALAGAAFHFGAFGEVGRLIEYLQAHQALGWTVVAALVAAVLAWTIWFLAQNRPEDRGPVVTIFIYILFNAFFWIAFEQAGTSINLFTKQNTDRSLLGFEVPATWFQSVNAGLIFLLAPLFAAIWTRLGRRNMNPSQPVKISLGLLFLGFGYVFMVLAGRVAAEPGVKASMMFILMTYLWHTVGELCLSPTGLSYVTKTAPVRFVSLLMGIWFVSSFVANLGGGLVAAQVKNIETGKLTLPWDLGAGQTNFFFLFVVTSGVAGLVILVFSPLLKRLGGGRE